MSFDRDEGGQAIVLIAITLLGLLFAVGLAMDVGQLYNGRRTAQEAADAAAFAGAVIIYQQGTSTQAKDAAGMDAYLNGYCAAGGSNAPGACTSDSPTSGTTVTIALPPTSGTRNNDSNCVAVTITTPVRTSLVPQQAGFTTVTARATGCYVPYSSDYAVVALDQTCTAGDVALQSNGSIVIHGGSIQVNSCGSPAADNSHRAVISIDTGFEVDVVGTVDSAANWPTSTYPNKPVQADPFATKYPPTSADLATMTTYGTPQCTTSTGTINQPGIYTSDAQSNCLFVFAPGTYVFKGAGIRLTGTDAAVCSGSRVNTTGHGAVTTPGTQVFVLADTTNISVGKMLIINSGQADEEGVVPSDINGVTATAQFAKTHTGDYTVTAGCTYTAGGGSTTDVSTADGGVFFYLTTANYPSWTGGCGQFNLGGSSVSSINAPTSGTYKGMLMWYDIHCTSTVSIGGGGSIYTSGSIYAPGATVQGNGNNATVVVSQIIAKKVDTQNADFTMNFNSGLNAQGHLPALVE
jgi:Flp pilus assembly protein TadG